MVAQLVQPFDSWDNGLVALCDALANTEREKVVVSRLEVTAANVALTLNDIVALALTVPCSARFKRMKVLHDRCDPKIQEIAKQLDRDGKLSQIFAEASEARDRIDQFVFSAFPEVRSTTSAQRYYLWPSSTALVDVSKRLGETDPFLRLSRRLSLWFKPSRDLSRYGIDWQDGRAVRALVLRLADDLGRKGDDGAIRACSELRLEKTRSNSLRGLAEIWSLISERHNEVVCGPIGILIAEICGELIDNRAESLDDEMLTDLSQFICSRFSSPATGLLLLISVAGAQIGADCD